jgi:hypothetical protein
MVRVPSLKEEVGDMRRLSSDVEDEQTLNLTVQERNP